MRWFTNATAGMLRARGVALLRPGARPEVGEWEVDGPFARWSLTVPFALDSIVDEVVGAALHSPAVLAWRLESAELVTSEADDGEMSLGCGWLVLRGGAPAIARVDEADDAEAFVGQLGEVLPGLALSPWTLAHDGSAVAEIIRA